MSQIEYIPISEFAARAGVSRQTIYKQVDNRLTAYCKTVNGKKVLSTKALELFSVNKNSTTVNLTDNQFTSQNLTATIELLQKQLEIKDKQIQDLSNRLEQALNNQSQSNFITASQTSLLVPAEQNEKQLHPESAPQKKQGFFNRLFRKD